MAATESCAACGCTITGRKTEAGDAVAFSGKIFCAECAAMILPPEEIAKLSSPGAVSTASGRMVFAKSPAKAGVLAADDDVIGEVDEAPAARPAVVAGIGSGKLGQPGKRATTVASVPASARTSPAQTPTVKAPASVRNGAKAATAAPGISPSRRTSVVAGVKGRKATTAPSVRPDADRNSRETGRGRRKAANSNGLYIGIGAGVLALVVGGYFLLSGDKTKKVTATKAVVATDDDKTTSTDYARKAEALLDKRDRKGAIQMYSKAAIRAEKEGNSDQGRIYGMKIVDLEKSSKITD